MERPLDGIFVVELTTYWAGPACGEWMSQLGARVVKVEHGRGDSTRVFGRTCGMPITDDENPSYDMFNGGKESLHIDLKSPEQMKILHNMLAAADVFLTSMRAGGLKKYGLDYDSLKEKYPRLIMGHATAYGSEDGPMSELPGLDAVAFFAMNGILSDLRMDQDSPPICPPTGMGDTTSGMALFGGVMAALFRRERTGKGDYVAGSLYGTGHWVTGAISAGTQYFNPWPRNRFTQSPMGQAFETSDGKWVQIFSNEYDRYFPVFCKAFGCEEFIDDPQLNSRANINKDNFAGCRKIVERCIGEGKKRTAEEIMGVLRDGNVPCQSLRGIGDKYLEQDQIDQCLANGYNGVIDYEHHKHYYQPQIPLYFKSVGVNNYAEHSRPMGADNEALFKEFGEG